MTLASKHLVFTASPALVHLFDPSSPQEGGTIKDNQLTSHCYRLHLVMNQIWDKYHDHMGWL